MENQNKGNIEKVVREWSPIRYLLQLVFNETCSEFVATCMIQLEILQNIKGKDLHNKNFNF